MELATGTIFLAGLATFASPCVLPMIPIYLSVLLGGSLGDGEEITPRARMRLLANGASFVLGFSVVFVLLGLTATALGQFMLTHRLLFQQLGGLLVFVFGLKFLGWLHIDALEREKRIHLAPSGKRLGPGGAFTMGLTFAFGWTPCIGPVLGAILTFTAVNATSMFEGALNLLVYAAGIGLPLLLVAVLAHRGVGLLNRVKRFIPRIEKVTGGVLVVMGVLMITDATSILTFGIGDDASSELSAGLAGSAGVAVASGPAPIVRGGPDAPAPEGGAAASLYGAGAGAGVCAGDGLCDIAPGDAAEAATWTPATASEGQAGERRAIYFWQPNCPSCHKLAPVIAAMSQTCAGRGLAVTRVDVSQTANKAMAARRGVRGTPTLVFEDGDGAEVARLVGAVGLDQIHEAVAVLMGQECADFTRFN